MELDLDNLPNLDLDDIDPDTIGFETADSGDQSDDKPSKDIPKGLFLPDDILVRLDMNLPKEATIDRTAPDGSLYRSIPAIVIKYFAATTFRDRLNSETLSMTIDSVEDGLIQNERGKFQTRQEIVTVHIKLTVKGENGHSQVHTAHGVGFGEASSELGPRYKAIAHKIALKSAETDAFCAALERFGSVFVKAKDARAIISYIKNEQRKRHEEKDRKGRIVPGTAAFKGRPIPNARPVKSETPVVIDARRNEVENDDVPPFELPDADISIIAEEHDGTPRNDASSSTRQHDTDAMVDDEVPTFETEHTVANRTPATEKPLEPESMTKASSIEAVERERVLNTLPEPETPAFEYDWFLQEVSRLDDIEKIVTMRELYEDDITSLDKKLKAKVDKAIRAKMQALLSSPQT